MTICHTVQIQFVAAAISSVSNRSVHRLGLSLNINMSFNTSVVTLSLLCELLLWSDWVIDSCQSCLPVNLQMWFLPMICPCCQLTMTFSLVSGNICACHHSCAVPLTFCPFMSFLCELMTDIEVKISISALFNIATNCSIGFSSSHMAETVANEQAALCWGKFAEIFEWNNCN